MTSTPSTRRELDGVALWSIIGRPNQHSRVLAEKGLSEASSVRPTLTLLDCAQVLTDLENGATLRAFLSRRLRCSAMRISKKFAGDKCLGKQIYLRRAASAAEAEAEARALAALEAAFVAAATRQAAAPAKRPRGEAAGDGRRRKAPRRPRAPAPAAPHGAAPRHVVSASESVGSGRDADDAASSSSDDDAAARRYGAAVPRRRGESPVRFKRLGSATALDRLGGAGAAPAAACAAFAGEARALAEAHRRAEAAAFSDGGGFPGGDAAAAAPPGGGPTPPPAQLLLELAPSGAAAAAGARQAPGFYALAIARGASSGALAPLGGGRARADSHASEGALLLTVADAPDDFAALRDDGPLDLDDAAWLDAFDSTTQVAAARAA